MSFAAYLRGSCDAIERMLAHPGAANVDSACEVIIAALRQNKPLLVCGNGGSASDAMHITGELVGRFLKERKAINCICLSSNGAVLTAWANDYAFETVFARQVEAYGRGGGALLGISTSGNSLNVVRAFETARALGIATIGMTGEGGGKLADVSDVLIDVPSKHTPIIQQVHICIYHYLCEKIEDALSDM
jgi:D-sedoheptulose 7-phosphate isomerase